MAEAVWQQRCGSGGRRQQRGRAGRGVINQRVARAFVPGAQTAGAVARSPPFLAAISEVGVGGRVG